MPLVRKLTPADLDALDALPSTKRTQIAAQYDAYLADFDVGDYGEVQFDAGDVAFTVRQRLQAAAARRGLALTFGRARGGVLWFRVGQVGA